MRQLKHHEKKLLRKVDLLNWKKTSQVHEARALRRFHISDREDYARYNKLIGYIHKMVGILRKLPSSDADRIRMSEALLDKLHQMSVIPAGKLLDECEKINVSDFCRRRLAVVLVNNKFSERAKDAVQLVEQGHVSIGPDVVSNPAVHVTREMEDNIKWSQGSKIKRHTMKYQNELDDFELQGI
jgi:U3 small nucleolar ribonucleoprotein protein IMP3